MKQALSLLLLGLLSAPTAWELDRRTSLWPELAHLPGNLRLALCGLTALALTYLVWEALAGQLRQSRRVVVHLQDPSRPSDEVVSR